MSPTFSFDPKKAIDAYFEAWRTHSTESLKEIFAPDASYSIDVEGKKTYSGLEDIKQYWRKNAERQKNLRTEFKIIASDSTHAQCLFFARFFDSDEDENQVVSGKIDFEFDSVGGKITSLREFYFLDRVKVEPTVQTQIRNALAQASSKLNSLVQGLSFWSWRVLKIFLGLSIFVGVVSAIFWFVEPPRWLIFLTMPEIWHKGFQSMTATQIAQQKVDVQTWLAFVLTLLGTVLGAIALFQAAGSGPNEIEEVDVTRKGEDLRVMNDHMRNAKNVAIFSGDFDFLSKSSDLRKTLSELANMNRLTLISDNERKSVRRAVANCAEAVFLLDQLEQDKRIAYSTNLRARCSFISKSGENVILNHFVTQERGRQVVKICIVRGRGRAMEITRAMDDLLRDWVSRTEAPTTNE